MDTSDFFKNTVMISLGLFMADSSTSAPKYFEPSEMECHAVYSLYDSPSSTRLNDSNRFSLEQLKHNKRKLQAFKTLESNWNGYGGLPFSESVLSEVEKIISNLDYQPEIFPTGRGTIQIEKFIDDNNQIEIEISQDEIFVYQVKDGKEIEKEISSNEINELISELYA